MNVCVIQTGYIRHRDCEENKKRRNWTDRLSSGHKRNDHHEKKKGVSDHEFEYQEFFPRRQFTDMKTGSNLE